MDASRPAGERNSVDFLDLTLSEAAADVALDEALLLDAEAGRAGEVLRLWERPAPAVVVGSGCKLFDDVDVAACDADGVPLVRRSSGGGTVLLARGCLCYSLVLAFERHPALTEIRSSYEWILSKVIEALAVGGAEQAGISDVALHNRKFSGNAQQRKRHHLLHHGTLLYAMDLSPVGRYLRLPQRQPEYREGREHSDFVRNVETTRERLTSGLRAVWDAHAERTIRPDLAAEAERLVREKYGTPLWTARR
jgi:lipoate-protein ligase A